MAVHRVHKLPQIAGFIVGRLGDVGGLVAERVDPLSEYQIQYGCPARVVADGPRELEWLCVAARVHAELVAKAEEALAQDRLHGDTSTPT